MVRNQFLRCSASVWPERHRGFVAFAPLFLRHPVTSRKLPSPKFLQVPVCRARTHTEHEGEDDPFVFYGRNILPLFWLTFFFYQTAIAGI